MPGHRAFLLGLKSKIEEFDKFESTLEERAANEKDHLLQKANKRTLRRNRGVNFDTTSPNIRENQEENATTEDLEANYDDILLELTAKIINFVKKKNIELNFDEIASEIDDLNLDTGIIEKVTNGQGKNVLKCPLKCIHCETRINCYYSTYWQVSNYELHLKKKHSKSKRGLLTDGVTGGASTSASSSQNSNENNSVVSTNSNQKEINPTSFNRLSINKSADINIQKKLNDVLGLDELHLDNIDQKSA